MKEITYKESLNIEDRIYIDVRSPMEFLEDHIPDANNIAIFDNNERSEVGKIYKAAGRNEAIIRGTEIVGKKLSEIIKGIDEFKDKNIIINCARGGMRSGSVAALLDSIGFKVYKLKFGYKGYRRYIIDRLESLKIEVPIFILQGFTGTGKTEIINAIDNSLDLEGMAGHRSSIFGGIGLEQKSQKHFETQIIRKIDKLSGEKYIVIEGESKKIGNLHIPPVLHRQMQESPAILIKCLIGRRVEIILKEYIKNIDADLVIRNVKSLKLKLGNEIVEELLEFFSKKNYSDFTKLLLQKYYDPLYKYSIDKIDYIAIIENNNTEQTVSTLKNCITKYLHN